MRIMTAQKIESTEDKDSMKKVEKGVPGYLDYKKKVEIIRTVIYFAIVAAIFFLGYFQTHTRLNLLTVVGSARLPPGIQGSGRCDREDAVQIR